MTGKLHGKVAVMTGATSGLGLAAARLFVEEGGHVFITGRQQERLDDAVHLIGRNVTGVRADAGRMEDLDRLFDTVAASQRKIDILFASAGISDRNLPIGAITAERFDATFGVNVRGTLFTVQKALPLMNDGGSIIMTGSMASAKGLGGCSVYNASKAALRSFARTWTVDLIPRRIRVNVLSPGPVNTAAFEITEKALQDKLVEWVPMGRIAEPEEIAKCALFLASDDSSFITGIELFVDGGAAQI